MIRQARFLSIGLLLLAGATTDAAERDDQTRMRDAGIEPTRDGIGQFLDSILAPVDPERVARLIGELGAERYLLRERATRQLAEMPFPAIEQLEAAARDDDPERAARARRILTRLRGEQSTSILLPVMRAVTEKKLRVGVPRLLGVYRHTNSVQVRQAVLAALTATIEASDRPAADELLQEKDLVLRNLGRRLLSHLNDPTTKPLLEGAFEAVKLTPGNVSGGGPNLVQGWEFTARTDLVVTELGIYDSGQNGLNQQHDVAIWDLEDRKSPVVETTFEAGNKAPLVGSFRYLPVAPVQLKAGRRYAVVAHYPSATDSSVSMSNPSGLKLEFADHLEIGGRRYTFPHQGMAFPGKVQSDPKTATFGPSFRFEAAPEP